MGDVNNTPKIKKKMATWKKVVIGIVLIAIIFIAGGMGYVYHLVSKTNHVELNKDNLGMQQDAANESKEDGIINIALFGIDAPQGQVGRSDADMILTIDKKHNKVKLTSIMRDSYVNVKGHGMTKLTHAYAYGGPELALNTLNTNFNLSIDKFITVNFTSLPKIIDTLGGIPVDITVGDLKYINGYIDNLNNIDKTNAPHINKTGEQTLNGIQALAYCRIRYDGGDQRRTQRQRTILEGVFKKVKAMPATDYPKLLDELLPYVTTNISTTEFLSLGKDVLSTNASSMIERKVPCDNHEKGMMLKGVYYMNFDLKAETEELHDFIFNS
ncbi:MAG: LCP family protein [Clostridium baratii]